MALGLFIYDRGIMGRYLVSFKVNWASFPAGGAEKIKVVGLIHAKTKEAMDKGILTDWGISLDLTYGYAIWSVEAAEMARIAIMRMPYLEPVDIRELLSLDKFAAITTEVEKANRS